MNLIESYLDNSSKSEFYLNGGCYWYVGLENSIDEGIKRFLSSLKLNGEILINEPLIITFIDDYGSDDIHFVIVAQALPKLQYLAYKAKKVNKNLKKTKV